MDRKEQVKQILTNPDNWLQHSYRVGDEDIAIDDYQLDTDKVADQINALYNQPIDERLLTDEEILNAYYDHVMIDDITVSLKAIAKAQLAKCQPLIRQQVLKDVGELMIQHAKAEMGLPPMWVVNMAINLHKGQMPEE